MIDEQIIDEQKMKRYIGIRNIVTSNQDWKYLMLYEIDTHLEEKCLRVISIYERISTSYIAYKTKNGFHFVGLSTLDAQQWGYYFQTLQRIVPEYFSGQTLRLSLKENEKQELIRLKLTHPYVERLAAIYFKRFNIQKEDIVIFGNTSTYSCVYEKYWSRKI